MPTASAPPANPTIATTQGIFPFARDCKLGTGTITTEPVPTINPTKVLIRWKVQDKNAATTDTSHYTEFGVWLYNDGRMSFAYGNLSSPNAAHVGFSNGDGLNYANIGFLEQRGGASNAPSIEVIPHTASTTTSSYDAYDRLSPDAGHSYDAAGNTKTLPGSQSFNYDGRNLVTSAATGSGSSNYSYDGEGRQISLTSGGENHPLSVRIPGRRRCRLRD